MHKIGISHKTFANKHRFHPTSQREQKCHFLINWHYKSLRKVGEATEYLHLRKSRWSTMNTVIAFRGGCCCLGMQSCKAFLVGNYTEILWWQILLGHFRMIITCQMLWNEIGPLVSQVLPSHSTKSHYSFDALGGIYLQNACPSPIIHINPFSHKSKTTSSEHKYFFVNEGIFFFGISITRFSCNTSKCALK